MNDFEIVKRGLEVNRAEMEDSKRTVSRNVMIQYTKQALEALDRIEEEYKNMENVISSEWG